MVIFYDEFSFWFGSVQKVEPDDITSLSVPLPFKTEHGQYTDLRIPSPVPQPGDKLDIHAVSISMTMIGKLLLWMSCSNLRFQYSVLQFGSMKKCDFGSVWFC